MKANKKVNKVFWIFLAFYVYFIVPKLLMDKLSLFFNLNLGLSKIFGLMYLGIFLLKTSDMKRFYKENGLSKYDK